MLDSGANRQRGESLRAYIEARLGLAGLTSLAALATRVELRPSTISEWWSRGKEPDLSTLRRVAAGLRVPVTDLVAAYEGQAVEDVLAATVMRALRRVAVEQDERAQMRAREASRMLARIAETVGVPDEGALAPASTRTASGEQDPQPPNRGNRHPPAHPGRPGNHRRPRDEPGAQ